MTPRVTVSLTPEERSALLAKAYQERRNPREEAAIIIRHALEQAGYLQPIVPPYVGSATSGTVDEVPA